MTIVALNAVDSPAQLAWAFLWRYWIHSLWIWIPVGIAMGLFLISWAMGNEGNPNADMTPIYVTYAILRLVANLGVGLVATIFAMRAMNGKVFGKSTFYLANKTEDQIRIATAPRNLVGVAWNISWRFILPVNALWAFAILAVLNFNFGDATAFYGLTFFASLVAPKFDPYVFVSLGVLMACAQFLFLIWVLKSQHLKGVGGSTFLTATVQNDEASADAN